MSKKKDLRVSHEWLIVSRYFFTTESTENARERFERKLDYLKIGLRENRTAGKQDCMKTGVM